MDCERIVSLSIFQKSDFSLKTTSPELRRLNGNLSAVKYNKANISLKGTFKTYSFSHSEKIELERVYPLTYFDPFHCFLLSESENIDINSLLNAVDAYSCATTKTETESNNQSSLNLLNKEK